MAKKWLHQGALLALATGAALLAACGSSTVESALEPERLVIFGDAHSDLNANGARFTVNDDSVNVWVAQLALDYGKKVEPVTQTNAPSTSVMPSTSGKSYARGNARIGLKPDAAGNAATATVQEQVSQFLAEDAIGENDLLVISGGVSDIVVQMAALNAGLQTEAQMLQNVQTAGRELGAQVQRLVDAGAKYVLLSGAYNLGNSPWAIASEKTALLNQASHRFNDALLISVVDLGDKVLYVDAAYYFNLLTNNPGNYSFTDSTTVVCNSVDSGNGIGIGVGEVNASLCTKDTLNPNLDYAKYVFADKIYFTPAANRLFGDHAYSRMRDRF